MQEVPPVPRRNGPLKLAATHKFPRRGEKIVADYANYIQSFINIDDAAISQKVDSELAAGKLWPEPLLQFNPA